MYHAMKRISDAYLAAHELPLNDSSKIVVMSDCHRGDGSSRADNFARNQVIYFAALTQYDDERFTYIELGDGDELWENRSLSDIVQAYSAVYGLMRKFYLNGRLYMVYGNHDYVKKNPGCVKRNYASVFPNIKLYESLILRHSSTGGSLFLLHGHQADFLNDPLWKFTRFLVRYVWRSLELVGVNNPTSAAKSFNRRDKVEKTLIRWADRENEFLIAGHTHRPVFPTNGGRYFNDGCCVHPNGITAIEIVNGQIALVKWGVKTRGDGTMYIGKDILEGPISLRSLFRRL